MRLAVLTAGLLLLAASSAGLLFTVGEARGEIPGALRFLAPSQALEREAAELIAREGPSAFPRAETVLRDAVRRDPSSAYRWAALGEHYLATERIAQARRCMTRAAELGPSMAQILIRNANFHFALDEPAAAMSYGRRILALIPDYDALVFAVYARMGIPAAEVLKSGVPPLGRPAAAYFRSLVERGAESELDPVWNWLEAHGWSNDRLASDYAGHLLARNEYTSAMRIWARHLGQRRGVYPDLNRVYNGGFEEEFTPAVLDWKLRPADGAMSSRESGMVHGGKTSLRVDFLGVTNVAFDHVAQAVVVEPGAYRFRAFIKTNDITTDQGVRFRIADAVSPARFETITDGINGTIDWTAVERTIRIPSATHLVNVQVVRQASMKFDNKIRGTAWVDDVSLTPVAR